MARTESLDLSYAHPSWEADATSDGGAHTWLSANAAPVAACGGCMSANYMHAFDLMYDADLDMSTARPLVIFFHGQPTDKAATDIITFARALADSGFIVMNCNYPQETGAVHEGENPVTWIKTRAYAGREAIKHGRDRIDPTDFGLTYSHIIPLGSSTGGLISVLGMIGSPDNAVEIPVSTGRVDALAALWTTLPDPTDSIDRDGFGAGTLVEDKGYNYFTGTAHRNLFLAHGTLDLNPPSPYESGIEIARQAREAGLYVEFLTLVGSPHASWADTDEIIAALWAFIGALDDRVGGQAKFLDGSGQAKFLD
jgi:hypothetical protein